MFPNPKKVVFILGPTASGKTNLGYSIAKHLNTQVVSADSRQVYKELNIGTAVPKSNEILGVPHHLLQHISIYDSYSAAQYSEEALNAVFEIHKKNDVAIVVGGTGLYFNSIEFGFDSLPKADEELRTFFEKEIENFGIEKLQTMLKEKDFETYQKIDIQNPRRLVRSLEIIELSGNKASKLRTGNLEKRPFEIIKIGIDIPREILYQRINNRVDEMILEGLEMEAFQFNNHRNLQALNTVGYKEWWSYFDGIESKEFVIDKIKQHTRNFAKRQLTWFKRDKEINWWGTNEIDIFLPNMEKLGL